MKVSTSPLKASRSAWLSASSLVLCAAFLLLTGPAIAADISSGSDLAGRKPPLHETIWYEGKVWTDRDRYSEPFTLERPWRMDSIREQVQVMELWLHEFDDLPADILQFPNLKELEISFDDDFTVDERWKLPSKLEHLRINDADKMHFGRRFPKLRRLLKLELVGDSDSTFMVPAQWCDMENLEALALGVATEVTFETAVSYPRLTELSLISIALKELPVGFESSPVETLTLSGNKLSQLPAAIQYFLSLRSIELYQNELRDLPDYFLELKQLKSLSLAVNDFTRIPRQVYQMPQLEFLYIGGQDSLVLTDSIGLLNNLRELYLNHSKIQALPESIGKLTQLEVLTLSGNRLRTLPESICNCKPLRKLQIGANPIEELPSCLLELPKLEGISCESKGLMQGNLDILSYVLKDAYFIPQVPDSIEGKPLSEYLERTDIDSGSKLYMQGKIGMQSDAHYRTMLDSMLTQNDATRPYYIALILSILSPTNGDPDKNFAGMKFSLYPLVDSLGKLTRMHPKWFLDHVLRGPYAHLYPDWIKSVPILAGEFRQVETFIAYIREKALTPDEARAYEKDLFRFRWDLIERHKWR